eukprot:EG_transcript_33841
MGTFHNRAVLLRGEGAQGHGVSNANHFGNGVASRHHPAYIPAVPLRLLSLLVGTASAVTGLLHRHTDGVKVLLLASLPGTTRNNLRRPRTCLPLRPSLLVLLFLRHFLFRPLGVARRQRRGNLGVGMGTFHNRAVLLRGEGAQGHGVSNANHFGNGVASRHHPAYIP